MDQLDRALLKKLWITTAHFYDRELDPDVLELYVGDLEDLELPAVQAAFKTLRLGPKGAFMPRPPDIREIVAPPVDDVDVAVTVATAIQTAIRTHDYTWPGGYWHGEGKIFVAGKGPTSTNHTTWEGAVRTELGELGWEVVRRIGWDHLVALHRDGDGGQFHAQLRDRVRAIVRLAKASRLNELPALPQGPSTQIERKEGPLALASTLSDAKARWAELGLKPTKPKEPPK